MSIVHVTPTVLDLRAITVFGLHAKPNSDSPIGKFGTGLKYAIATLIRLGCRVQIFIDGVEYEFYTKKDDFRGVEFQRIRMKKRRSITHKWGSTELPFTTEHGKFWQAWQAFRELESNTRDEGGSTYELADGTYVPDPIEHYTSIVVTGEPYEDAWRDRDAVFLPEAKTAREGDDRVQVFNEPSNHLYWRGIRVMDLEKPSMYTYNILSDLELTEDRTIKYTFTAMQAIAGYVARSKDERLVSAVVSAKKEAHFEGRLDFDYVYESPSPVFLNVIAKKRARGGYVSSSASGYFGRYAPSPARAATTREKIELYAYDVSLPEELQELLKHLLTCEIREPVDESDVQVVLVPRYDTDEEASL